MVILPLNTLVLKLCVGEKLRAFCKFLDVLYGAYCSFGLELSVSFWKFCRCMVLTVFPSSAAIKFASTRFRASHKNADPVAGVWMERHGENELPRIIQMPRASKQVDQAAVVSLPRLHLAAMSLTKHRGSGSTPSTTIA
ncbi:uncharacterized protein LOC112340769 [Selaginella moellendorffii]|uniref:uncharacterized protein LOC112340769 n=1 Tax=Selaginella moellendorffii TaxID=88036 RepID=UPI000D1D1047|nr:uncharacterized protein LOC112340769 [Selaginella moellendorffii]|eukprot:XP_024515535.1 uncharacterized protein LOC112340769 [Selaginella moellendorffii]